MKIAIVGLGFMGGSLAAACRRKFPKSRILGISRNPTSLRFARKKRWVHETSTDLDRAVSADLVILCTPVDTFPKILSRLEQKASAPLRVTDIGSVKGDILRRLRGKRLRKVQFVGAHPMAGSHQRGIHAAAADIYDGGFTFLIREKGVPRSAYQMVKAFWKKITPRIVELSAGQHDRLVSEISHLPHAVAACLVLTPEARSLRFAACGFRGATRIAQGHPSIWLPIFLANQKAILKTLSHFQKNVALFCRALAAKKVKNLSRMLSLAAKKRSQI